MSLVVGTTSGKIYKYQVSSDKIVQRIGRSAFDNPIAGAEFLSGVGDQGKVGKFVHDLILTSRTRT